MNRLTKNLKKYFFIETSSYKLPGMDVYTTKYTVWYAHYITFLVFGRKITVIIGLDHSVADNMADAKKFMNQQKQLYKTAVLSKRR